MVIIIIIIIITVRVPGLNSRSWFNVFWEQEMEEMELIQAGERYFQSECIL